MGGGVVACFQRKERGYKEGGMKKEKGLIVNSF